MRASCAEVGGDVGPLGEAAVDAADPAGAHEADPGQPRRPRACRRPSSRRARPRHAGGEVARPGLACVGTGLAEALQLVGRRARRRPAPSSTPTVAGTAPSALTAASAAEPHLHPHPGRETVCDERSLERDDRAAVVEGLLHFRGDSERVRSRRHRPELLRRSEPRLRARARSRRRGSPPRARRPAPVVSTTSASSGGYSSMPSGRAHLDAARASLHDRRLGERVGAADHLPLGLVGEDDVGRELRPGSPGTARRRTRGSRSTRRGRRPRAPREPAPAAPPPGPPPRSARPAARSPRGAARRSLEPRRLELVRAQLGRDAAVGRHRPLAVGRDECHHRSGRAADDRPDELDPAPLEQRPHERAGRVIGLLRHAARRLAELGRPRRHVGRLARPSRRGSRPACRRPAASGSAIRTITSSSSVAEGADHERNRTIAAWIGSHVGAACARS